MPRFAVAAFILAVGAAPIICAERPNILFIMTDDHAYTVPGQETLITTLRAELLRLKEGLGDRDQLASEPLPNGVDGTVEELRDPARVGDHGSPRPP